MGVVCEEQEERVPNVLTSLECGILQKTTHHLVLCVLHIFILIFLIFVTPLQRKYYYYFPFADK